MKWKWCQNIVIIVYYLLKAAVTDMDHLNNLIDHLIPYGVINTLVVLNSPVPEKVILPSKTDQQINIFE